MSITCLAFSNVPKRRQRHYSYDEGVDEPPKLIDDEPVEVEKETPTEDRRPVEPAGDENNEPPVFED